EIERDREERGAGDHDASPGHGPSRANVVGDAIDLMTALVRTPRTLDAQCMAERDHRVVREARVAAVETRVTEAKTRRGPRGITRVAAQARQMERAETERQAIVHRTQ